MDDFDFSTRISVIGGENQTLSITLKKNEKIFINKQYISFSSSIDLDELIYKSVDSLLNANINNSSCSTSQINKKIDNPFIIRIKNKKENFEYLGLSRGGKIMKIISVLYPKLYIRSDCLLAFSDSIEALDDNEVNQKLNKIFQGRGIFKINGFKDFIKYHSLQKQFYLVKLKCNERSIINKVPQNTLKSTNNNNNFVSLLSISSYLNDYIYISGKKNLIEKRLGERESMVVMYESIVLFENTISFNPLQKDVKNLGKYVNPYNDIIVEGPGLIVFEPVQRDNNLISPKLNYNLAFLAILLLIGELLTQIYIHNNIRH